MHVRYLGMPLMSRKLRSQSMSHYDQTACSIQFLGDESIIVCRQIAVDRFSRCVPGSCGLDTQILLAELKSHWYNVCMPKAEGGLGLRNLIIWNRVLCLRFVWLLFSDNALRWAQWHRQQHMDN